MKIKKLVPALLVLVGLGVSACQNNNSASESNHKSSSSKSIKIRKVKPKKSKKSEKAETTESNASSSASSSSSSSQENSSKQTSDLPGDDGLLDIPANMQGTWYGVPTYTDDSDNVYTITLTQHTVTIDTGDGEKKPMTLHKRKQDFDPSKYAGDQATQEKYKNIASGSIINLRGYKAVYYRGWFQTAGAGSNFYIVQDGNNPVLVDAGGAGAWAEVVYWKSADLAKQNAGKKISGVVYSDDN